MSHRLTPKPRTALTLSALSALFMLAACDKTKSGEELTSSPNKVTTTTTATVTASATAPAPSAAPPGAKKAEPKQDKKLDKSERQRFLEALGEGRKLHKKGDYSAAIEAFEKALAISPDDPHALGELGWAAFFAKDFERAEARTREALKRTADPELKGAWLYNLGRIAEERGHKDEAVGFYRQSLRERPNKTVRERLAKLDPTFAEAMSALAITPMQGPFASIEDFCASARKAASGKPFQCEVDSDKQGEIGRVSFAGKAHGPYLGVQGVWTAENENGADWFPYKEYHLALQTKEGWFVTGGLAGENNPGAFGISGQLEPTRLDFEDVGPGGAHEVLFGLTNHIADSDLGLNEASMSKDKLLVVCGIGASGKPSCTGAIPTYHEAERFILSPEGDEPGAKHEGLFKERWTMAASFNKGELELGSKDKLPDERKALLGKHALSFR